MPIVRRKIGGKKIKNIKNNGCIFLRVVLKLRLL